MTAVRRHDLDALRGFAMLLGIALHASLSFFPSPWPVRDPQQNGLLGLFFLAIHGFRMPLFFIVSGYFTLMVCRKRGLAALLRQRTVRVLIPCLIGLVTIVPVTRWIAGQARRTPVAPTASTSLAQAIRQGDSEAIDRFVHVAGEADRFDDEFGITPLSWAALRGDVLLARRLLDVGADPNGSNRDGNRPLHAAAFAGLDDLTRLLLERRADPAVRNARGELPLASSRAPWDTTRFIYDAVGLAMPDQARLEAGRVAVRRVLETAMASDEPRVKGSEASRDDAMAESAPGGAERSRVNPLSTPPPVKGLNGLPTPPAATGVVARYQAWLHSPIWRVSVGRWSCHLFDSNVFMHLWFLWFLIMYAAGFALIWGTMRRWLALVPIRMWAWGLIVLTPLPMLLMGGGESVYFGPDTSMSWLPFPHLFVYYGLFFAFGVAMQAWEARVSADLSITWSVRWLWPFQLGLALLIVFPVCVTAAGNREVAIAAHFLYVWWMSLGLIGGCRALLSRERPVVRYFSDASYWLYLAHLPLVIALQASVRPWPWGAFAKFALIHAIALPLLLASYHFLVRRTWLGALLNGRSRFVAEATG